MPGADLTAITDKYGRYETQKMPTKIALLYKDAGGGALGNLLGMADTSAGSEDLPAGVVSEERLAGYQVRIESLPEGATLTLPHQGIVTGDGTDVTKNTFTVESDAYRTSAGATANSNVALVNRQVEQQGGHDATQPYQVRADGMVVTAARQAADVNADYLVDFNGVTYDVSSNVVEAEGGDAGLVYIPETAISGMVWDDSYQPVENDTTLDQAAKNRSYNGLRETWTNPDDSIHAEPGLAGRTLLLSQWQYSKSANNSDKSEGTWNRVAGFGNEDGHVTWGWVDTDNDASTPAVWQRITADNVGTAREGFRSTVSGNVTFSEGYGSTSWTWANDTRPDHTDETLWNRSTNLDVVEGNGSVTLEADGTTVKGDDNGNYIFDQLPTAAIQIQTEVEGATIQADAANRIGTAGQQRLLTTPFDEDNNVVAGYQPVPVPGLYGDDYYLLSYQLEAAGLDQRLQQRRLPGHPLSCRWRCRQLGGFRPGRHRPQRRGLGERCCCRQGHGGKRHRHRGRGQGRR